MTSPVPGPRRTDIPALHAAIAAPSVLQRERRALYQLAVNLLDGDRSRVLDHDVIDSPLARQQIGEALAGRSRLVRSQLVGISALATTDCAAHDLQVASRPEANALLADALDDIGAELWRRQETPDPPRVLTATDGERFTSALAVLRDGVALARSISPELIEDLLAHIALVAILDPQRAGGLASGSSRTFPGLILLESPRSSIEVAEALVHEGAHEKLFDLGITHDLLPINSDQYVPFHPPWAPEDRFWSLQRTLAACHAYACLAQFAQQATLTLGIRVAGPGSLLPMASERSEIIGSWLLDKGDYLGADAHTLLEGLLGRRPHTTVIPASPSPGSLTADYVIDTRLQIRRVVTSARVLIGIPAEPPQLYWVSEDAATVLELLGNKPLDEIADTLAHRWQVPLSAAHDRLTVLLADLCASGLVTRQEH